MLKKIILWVFILSVLVLGVGTVSSAIYHHIMRGREDAVLAEYGVGKPVDVEGKKINVFSYGNPESDTTIVFMAGLGAGDAVISARPMLNKLQERFRISIVDRAGNGMSDDTEEDRTVDVIVQEYRQAMKNSGSAPYLLMAHSIAGMYAEYWASQYPQEVAGIVYLDCTPAEAYAEKGRSGSLFRMRDWVENFVCSTGLQRFLMPKAAVIGEEEKNLLSEQERELCLLLMYRHTFSKATLSERELCYQNSLTVLENRNIDQTPQLYLAADCLYGEYYDEVFRGKLDSEFGDDTAAKNECMQKLREELKYRVNYAVVHGNVTLQYISGPHVLYRYAPTEIAEAVLGWYR